MLAISGVSIVLYIIKILSGSRNFFIVSAFYGEHPNKRIFCTGHIWTKSKFLGLSIGVEMVGQGITLFICVKFSDGSKMAYAIIVLE